MVEKIFLFEAMALSMALQVYGARRSDKEACKTLKYIRRLKAPSTGKDLMACRGLRRLEIGGDRNKMASDVDGNLKLGESVADFFLSREEINWTLCSQLKHLIVHEVMISSWPNFHGESRRGEALRIEAYCL